MSRSPILALLTRLDPGDMLRIRSRPEIAGIRASDDPDCPSALSGCHIAFVDHVSEVQLEHANCLRWVQARSAGVNHYPLARLSSMDIVLTNGNGAHGIPVAETILSMMLSFSTALQVLYRGQTTRTWLRPEAAAKRFELEGQTLLVIGLGDLGANLARKAHGIGMTVIGCDLPHAPGVAYVSRVAAPCDLASVLPAADHVAVCVPLTASTEGLLGSRQISAMRRGSYLYNASRGAVVDRTALHHALRSGHLAGAGLDVTDPEPIPHDDPVWDVPNVVLTQHTAGASPWNSTRVADIFLGNLARYVAGEPLSNVVDLDRGF